MIKINKCAKYIKPILVLDKYTKNEEVNEIICSVLADFFNDNSDFKYEHIVDGKAVGYIAGNINLQEEKPLNTEVLYNIIKEHPEYHDQVIFQIRIMEKIFELDTDDLPEVECLASLEKGYGKILIKKWEDELIKRNIKQYHLFSDENCNYTWYTKNGFKLIKSAEVKIDDLPSIKAKHKSFNVVHFTKEIL